jgi:hypothetical protein
MSRRALAWTVKTLVLWAKAGAGELDGFIALLAAHWSLVNCHLLLGAFVADSVFCFHVHVDRVFRPSLR